MIELPESLINIRDALIDHVMREAPLPNNLRELISWYEDSGFDYLVPDGKPLEFVLNMNSRTFSESELGGELEIVGNISDNQKIEHAKSVLIDDVAQLDDDICQTIHSVELVNADEEYIVVGFVIEMDGPIPLPIFQGAFIDENAFLEHLRSCGYLNLDDVKSLKDEELLKLWSNS